MEGCDYETIAEILDMPIGTSQPLHRARLQLRDQLKEMLQENLADDRTGPAAGKARQCYQDRPNCLVCC